MENMNYKELLLSIIDNKGIETLEEMNNDGILGKSYTDDEIHNIKDTIMDKILDEVEE